MLSQGGAGVTLPGVWGCPPFYSLFLSPPLPCQGRGGWGVWGLPTSWQPKLSLGRSKPMGQHRLAFMAAAFMAAIFLLAGALALLSSATQASPPVQAHMTSPAAKGAAPGVASWVDIAPFPMVTVSPTPGV